MVVLGGEVRFGKAITTPSVCIFIISHLLYFSFTVILMNQINLVLLILSLFYEKEISINKDNQILLYPSC